MGDPTLETLSGAKVVSGPPEENEQGPSFSLLSGLSGLSGVGILASMSAENLDSASAPDRFTVPLSESCGKQKAELSFQSVSLSRCLAVSLLSTAQHSHAWLQERKHRDQDGVCSAFRGPAEQNSLAWMKHGDILVDRSLKRMSISSYT